ETADQWVAVVAGSRALSQEVQSGLVSGYTAYSAVIGEVGGGLYEHVYWVEREQYVIKLRILSAQPDLERYAATIDELVKTMTLGGKA
ncbi:MAG: hypothetical protein MUC99_04795, partial [Anaerolineae bacterium]|nr:hypothetical protein [Anaerolineae bacterium]